MKVNNTSNKTMVTREAVEQYKLLYPMLAALLDEMKELSKKKQDGMLNAMKVKLANRILSKVKSFMSEEPTDEFLDLLDEENLPTNSDAVLIISQFKAAMDRYRSKHYTYKKGIGDTWNVSNASEDEDNAETNLAF